MTNNFQRIGSTSNAHVGREFEDKVLNYFDAQDIKLQKDFPLSIGTGHKKKIRSFDLGCRSQTYGNIIVECKSHTWTSSGKVPSAKITVWNEAMYYFYLAPKNFRKIFFILKDVSDKRGESLGEYYIRRYSHLIPNDVEIMEYDVISGSVQIIYHTDEYK